MRGAPLPSPPRFSATAVGCRPSASPGPELVVPRLSCQVLSCTRPFWSPPPISCPTPAYNSRNMNLMAAAPTHRRRHREYVQRRPASSACVGRASATHSRSALCASMRLLTECGPIAASGTGPSTSDSTTASTPLGPSSGYRAPVVVGPASTSTVSPYRLCAKAMASAGPKCDCSRPPTMCTASRPISRDTAARSALPTPGGPHTCARGGVWDSG